jgi:hypothetical protein
LLLSSVSSLPYDDFFFGLALGLESLKASKAYYYTALEPDCSCVNDFMISIICVLVM